MLKRLSMGAVGGAAISIGLGLAMMGMISAEFEAQEKLPALDMQINPVEDPIIDIDLRIEIDDFEEVEIPPAPPVIETVERTVPGEPIVDEDYEPPIFVKPVIDPGNLTIAVSDTDAQPIQRIEPNMPPRAERSGHCMMRFDVSAAGKPFNVAATYCSQDMFERSSIRAVHSWTYRPKIQNGKATARKNVVTRMSFNLLDESGKLIPD